MEGASLHCALYFLDNFGGGKKKVKKKITHTSSKQS